MSNKKYFIFIKILYYKFRKKQFNNFYDTLLFYYFNNKQFLIFILFLYILHINYKSSFL